jgi:hypothetical protein
MAGALLSGHRKHACLPGLAPTCGEKRETRSCHTCYKFLISDLFPDMNFTIGYKAVNGIGLG